MTSTSPTDSTQDSVGYFCGDWIPLHQMRLGIDDVGFRQGVTAVERLRTYLGSVFALDRHLERWNTTTSTLGIAGLPGSDELSRLIPELVQRNEAWWRSDGETGVTLFATPGASHGPNPTFGMHVNRINLKLNETRRRIGQPLIVTSVLQPSSHSWPRGIKVRARIHYHLADSHAKSCDPASVGVLLDEDGSITETSIANVAIVCDSKILSPPSDRVLGGITQSVIEQLAAEAGILWSKMPIRTEQLLAAAEVMMMGTDGGIWFVNAVDGKAIAKGRPGPIFARLRDLFDLHVNAAK